MDKSFLDQYKKIYGAILLFPYTKESQERSIELFQMDPSSIPGLTFVPQVCVLFGFHGAGEGQFVWYDGNSARPAQHQRQRHRRFPDFRLQGLF